MSAYAEVPVDDNGASLMVPRSLLSELLDASDAQERNDIQRSHAGDYITTLLTGHRTSLQSLGNQPSHLQLLDEVKGWPAIAGSAVAQRLMGLADNLHVFSKHVVSGKMELREQPDHRLSKTLESPNHVFTMSDMIWLLAWHLQQVGEGYWQKLTDGVGLTVELWPLPPAAVTPVPDETLGISGYMVRDGKGKETALGLDEVIRFWSPDPKTLFSAMGRLGPQALEYDASRFLDEHHKGTFENNATPDLIVTGQKDASAPEPEDIRDFHRKWRSQYHRRSGTARALPAFVPTGFDIKELTKHGVANETIALKTQYVKQFLAAYGVPGTALGMDENVNRATAEAADYIFDKGTITYYAKRISDALTVRLARDFDNKLAVGFRPFVAPDKVHDLKVEEQDLKLAVRSVQTVLTDRGDDPKDAPWGEKPILPFNVSPYSGDFSIEDRVKLLGDAGLAEGITGQGGRASRDRISVHGLSMTRDDPMDVSAAQARMVRIEKSFVGPLAAEVLRVLRSQKLDIEERLEAIPDSELLAPAEVIELPRSQRATQVRVISSEIAKKLFDPATWDGVFAAAIDDHLRDPFIAAANDATQTVASEDFVFSLFAQDAVKSQVFKLAGNVDQTTLRAVEDAVTQALNNGEGRQGIIKRLESTFSRKRARVIARTEILTAVQEGQVQGWRSTGQVDGKQWHISGNDTRDTHLAADGQIVALGAAFILGDGEQANAPGDTTLTPANRVNCQCFVTPVIIGGNPQ